MGRRAEYWIERKADYDDSTHLSPRWTEFEDLGYLISSYGSELPYEASFEYHELIDILQDALNELKQMAQANQVGAEENLRSKIRSFAILLSCMDQGDVIHIQNH